MKLSDIESRIAAWYAASIEPGGPSFHLQSKPGRGKTSVLKLAPKILADTFGDGEYGVTVINGANASLTTLMGYLWPTERTVTSDGVEVVEKYSEFTKPYWWLTEEGRPLTDYVGGIIIVDEEDKLGLDEKKIVGEGALSKVLGNHRLPPGWVIWMAGNLQSDRSGSTKQLDHLINRRNRVEVSDDIKSTCDWMEKVGNCLPETIVFAEENPQVVFMNAPEVQGPWCTPRSLVAQDIYLRNLMSVFQTDKIPTDPLVQEEVAGGIGAGATAQLFATIKLGQELPSYEEIVANAGKAKVPHKPDAMRLAAYKLASRVSDHDADKVLMYMDRFPQEFQTIFVRFAAQRNKNIIMNPHMAAWCGKNAALVAIVQRYK